MTNKKDGDSSRRFEATATLHSIWGRRSWWIPPVLLVLLFFCLSSLPVCLTVSLCVCGCHTECRPSRQVCKFSHRLFSLASVISVCLSWKSISLPLSFSAPFSSTHSSISGSSQVDLVVSFIRPNPCCPSNSIWANDLGQEKKMKRQG